MNQEAVVGDWFIDKDLREEQRKLTYVFRNREFIRLWEWLKEQRMKLSNLNIIWEK